MDLMLDRALTYLDQLDQSNGIFIHLNWAPVRHKGSNMILDGSKLGIGISKYNVGPKQTQLSPNHEGSNHGCTNPFNTTCSTSESHMTNMLKKVGPGPLRVAHPMTSKD